MGKSRKFLNFRHRVDVRHREYISLTSGTYTKEDYPEIRRISKDRDNLDETWAAWKKNKDKAKKGFQRPGINLVDIPVKPQELLLFCQQQGLIINGSSRSQLVQHKVAQMFKD